MVDLMLPLLLQLTGSVGTAMALTIKPKPVPRHKIKPFLRRIARLFKRPRNQGTRMVRLPQEEDPIMLMVLTTRGRSGMLRACQ
jgi:hypothetical protein